VPQVVLDRGRADEQLRRGLPVGVTLDDQPGDLGLLRRQRQGRFRVSRSRAGAGGLELGPGPRGEALGAHVGEGVEGGTELAAGLPPAAPTPQPLSVDQVTPLQVRRRVGTAQQFGTTRCMFESNFPVDNKSVSYVVLWNAFKHLAAGALPSD
jgi:hypothetical protein